MMDYGGYFSAHSAERNALDSSHATNPFHLNASLGFAATNATSTGSTYGANMHQQHFYGHYASSYGQLAETARCKIQTNFFIHGYFYR